MKKAENHCATGSPEDRLVSSIWVFGLKEVGTSVATPSSAQLAR